MDNTEASNVLDIMCEISTLSRLPRIGWILAGVNNPESISDHCFETAIIAYFLSKNIEQNVDLGKILLMALFHEIGEVRLSDLPRRAKPYVKDYKKQSEQAILFDVLGKYADDINEVLDEFERKDSIEARLTEAAEELQIIFKALLYAKENNGDISEYRIDVAKYDALGIDFAQEISEIISERINIYLENKPYWEIGYNRFSRE